MSCYEADGLYAPDRLAEGIAALEPELAGRFAHALFFADEGHLDPRAALRALTERLSGLAVRVRFGVDVAPGELAGRTVIDCTGLAARTRLPQLRGVKGEMLLLHSDEVTLTRPVRVLHPRVPLYVVPRGQGLFMVGATMIESDEQTRISARSMLELLSAAYALHPAFGEARILEIGTGVRAAFPDNLPRLQRVGGTPYQWPLPARVPARASAGTASRTAAPRGPSFPGGDV